MNQPNQPQELEDIVLDRTLEALKQARLTEQRLFVVRDIQEFEHYVDGYHKEVFARTLTGIEIEIEDDYKFMGEIKGTKLYLAKKIK